MPTSKYRLQTVLEDRDKTKQQARGRVAACREKLAHAEDELSRRLRALDACRARQTIVREQIAGQSGRLTKVHDVVEQRTYLAELRREEQELTTQVKHQRAVTAQAASELERAMTVLVEASKGLQVVEKHQENWRRGKQLEEERTEQKLHDEIGAILHRHRSPR